MLPKRHVHSGYHGYCMTCFVFFFLFEIGQSHETRQAIMSKLLRRRHRDASIKDSLPPGRETSIKEKSRTFMEDIFNKYGKDGVMTFEGFEHLLQNLGLGNLHIKDHDIHDHFDNGKDFVDLHNDEHDHHNHENNKTSSADGHVTVHPHDDSYTETPDDHTTTDSVLPENKTSSSTGNSDSSDRFSKKVTKRRTKVKPTKHKNSYPVPAKQGPRQTGENHGIAKREAEQGSSDHNHDSLGHNTDYEIQSSNHSNHDHSGHDHRESDHAETSSDLASLNASTSSQTRGKCMTPQQVLKTYDLDMNLRITEQTFMYLCPALLVQIDSNACNKRNACPNFDVHEHCAKYHGYANAQKTVDDHHHGDDHDHHGDHDHLGDHSHAHTVANSTLQGSHTIFHIPLKVWGSAILSVLIISLVGLVGVAIVPIMQKVFYSQLLQFFIALAIGSLTGDALLHLIPHALIPHDHGHEGQAEGKGHDHSNNMDGVWKGLVALTGCYIFFQMERFMAIYADRKRKRKTKPQSPANNRVSNSKKKKVPTATLR